MCNVSKTVTHTSNEKGANFSPCLWASRVCNVTMQIKPDGQQEENTTQLKHQHSMSGIRQISVVYEYQALENCDSI